MSLVFVGMGLMAFLSASILAVDVGMLMTARNQAQNSADAGALAGATALAFDDYNDRSANGPAVTSAITTGKANQVMRADVSLTVADVQFPKDPSGEPNRVKVDVYRRQSRGNPLSTMIARFFGSPNADIGATATAEVAPANAVACPLPFTIPDRWKEMQTAPWDPINDDFDAVTDKGVPLATPDIYVGPNDKTNYTGYNAVRDKGMRVVLKADNGSKLAPSMYQVWDTVGGNRGPTTSDLASAGASRVTSWATATRSFTSPGCSRGRLRRASRISSPRILMPTGTRARTRSSPP